MHDEDRDLCIEEINPYEDAEDVIEFLPEPNTSTVETMRAGVGLREEHDVEGEEIEKPQPETDYRIVSAYIKDMIKVPVLTSDEECRMAEEIEKAERKAQIFLFELPEAVNELCEIGRKLEEQTINVADVTSDFDEMNQVQIVEEKTRNITASRISALKSLHGKKEEFRKILSEAGRQSKMELAWQLKRTEDEFKEILLDLKLTNKIVMRIIRKTRQRMKGMDCAGAVIAKHRLGELDKIENELRAVRSRLVKVNLRLVINIARKYLNRGLPLTDLIQEGNVGLMKAAERFDYRKGYKFSTYSTWWIRQAITRAISGFGPTVRIPFHVLESRKKINKATTYLLQELSEEPNLEEISLKVGLPLERTRRIMEAVCMVISIETPIGDDKTRLGDFIEDHAVPSPLAELLGVSLREEIDRVLSTLTPREEKVIKMRLGIGEGKESTLEEVGDFLGLTRERVRQIETKALGKLRHPSRRKRLEGFR